MCAQAQTPSVGGQRLDEYYNALKTKSQTYQTYKVVNERELDDFWRTVKDSIRSVKQAQRQTLAEMADLKQQVVESQNQLKEKNASMEGVLFDSTHIDVLGVSFAKSTFNTVFLVLTLGLLIGIVVVLLLLRYTRAQWRDRVAYAESVQKEFDDYKRKALDKEAKILRQLQDERNRYHSSAR